MLFNSLEFAVFFPIVITLYYLLPFSFRNLFLFISSCIFYMAFQPLYILILFSIIILDYIAGRLISQSEGNKRKYYLWISICANIGVLFIFKYFNFMFEIISRLTFQPSFSKLIDIALPLGLSFHTFQAMAYTIEVYKKKVAAEKNILVYALYVMFFPQLVAGPIERPQDLLPQIRQNHSFDESHLSRGLRLMLIGFFKKIFVADRLSLLVNHVFSNPQNFTGIPLLLAMYCFTFQIYYDFSGYTDIARGAANCLGFRLMRNFNQPFFAQTPVDFWRRWHISLSGWFRDYLYIPLGGNKTNLLKWGLITFTVFTLSGLWHGAGWTFVVWGVLHAMFIIFYKVLQKPISAIDQIFSRLGGVILMKVIKIGITFHLIAVAFVFFRAKNIADSTYIVSHFYPGLNILISQVQTFIHLFDYLGLGIYQFLLGILGVLSIELVEVLIRNNKFPLIFVRYRPLRWAFYYVIIFVILFLGEFSTNKFIYFQF